MWGIRDGFAFLGIGAIVYAISSSMSIGASQTTALACCGGMITILGIIFLILGIYTLRKYKAQLSTEHKNGLRWATYGVVGLCFFSFISMLIGFGLAADIIDLTQKPDSTISDLIDIFRSNMSTLIVIGFFIIIAYIFAVGGLHFWNKDVIYKIIIIIGSCMIVIPSIANVQYGFNVYDKLDKKYGNDSIENEEAIQELQEDIQNRVNYGYMIVAVLGYIIIGIPNLITWNKLPDDKLELKTKKRQIPHQYGSFRSSDSGIKIMGQTQYLRPKTPIEHQKYGKSERQNYEDIRTRILSRQQIRQTPKTGKKIRICRYCERQIHWRATTCPWCNKYQFY
jgi:hypothetical protein